MDKHAVSANHLLAHAALRTLTDVLGRHSIPFLPVKGVLTARTLYQHVADRPIRDIDIRVLPQDLPRLRSAAREAGWIERSVSASYRSVLLTIGGMPMDVETTVANPYMTRLTVAEMFAHARESTEPFGFAVRVPEFHHHVLLQCLNAYKDHLVDTADWAVQDLERTWQQPGFDVDKLLQVAARGANMTMLYVVARWLSEDRGAKPWATVCQRIGTPPRPRYAAAMLAWVRSGARHPSYMASLLARQTSDRLRDRVCAVGAMARFALFETGLRCRR